MSRIGKTPISLPSGVDVKVNGANVEVKGAKGSLSQAVDPSVVVHVEDGVVSLTAVNQERSTRALHGLYRALIKNMVIGVSEGYSKELTAVGVGYRAGDAVRRGHELARCENSADT